jgi:diguanylate cyclase (GGDEF)-like protein
VSVNAVIGLVTDTGPAGRMLRRILPIALILIGFSGVAALGGHRLGLVGIAVGAGLFAIANGVIVVVAIYWSAWLLHAEYTSRRRTQVEIEQNSLHDPLTGLGNRGFFIDQLARRAALADRRTSVPFAVCCLDLDGFKRFNEQFGREAGNLVLVKMGEVIRDCVRASDLVARLDGDKFGILLEEIADAKDVNILAQRIVSSVPKALAEIADAPISVSIGIILKTSGHDLPGDMLREADAALLLAKKRGPGRFELTAFAD